MRQIEPFFPRSHGIPRVDDRRGVSGIVDVIRHGLQWKDAPGGDGPHRTLYDRPVRWRRMGEFDRIFAALAAAPGVPERLMLDTTHLKAHRTAASLLKKPACSRSQPAQEASLLKKGVLRAASVAPKAA